VFYEPCPREGGTWAVYHGWLRDENKWDADPDGVVKIHGSEIYDFLDFLFRSCKAYPPALARTRRDYRSYMTREGKTDEPVELLARHTADLLDHWFKAQRDLPDKLIKLTKPLDLSPTRMEPDEFVWATDYESGTQLLEIVDAEDFSLHAVPIDAFAFTHQEAAAHFASVP
jgi:hypothetical protein